MALKSNTTKAAKTATNPESIYLPVKDFPYLKRYKDQFGIDEDTVAFPYKNKIYSNSPLPQELVIHEEVHFKQQEEIGADIWQERYLADPNFRVSCEVEAYRKQLSLFKDNKDTQDAVRIQCAKALSSQMYGNILTYKEAYQQLR